MGDADKIQGIDMSNVRGINTIDVEQPTWTTRYEIDYKAQSAYDFKDSGASTLGGVSHTVGDMAKATKCEIVAGKGLHFESDGGTATKWYNAAPITAPRVAMGVDVGANPLFAAASYTQALCFQAIITPEAPNLAVNYDEYGILLTNDAGGYYATTTRQYCSSCFASSGIGPKMQRAVDGTIGLVNGTLESSVQTFFELVFYPGGTVFATTTSDTDFIQPLTNPTFQKYITTNATITSTNGSIDWDKDDMYFAFYLANGGITSGTDFKFNVEKFRFLTLGV